MHITISEYENYLVLAQLKNDTVCKTHKVAGKNLIPFLAGCKRVVEVGLIECFECYTCCPETGVSGWDIHFIEGVKKYIECYYPDFDCFITKGYPYHTDIKTYEFHYLDKPQ